jgi:hypothetical protein
MNAKPGFTVESVDWEWLESPPAIGDTARRPPIKGRPLKIRCTCNGCGTRFLSVLVKIPEAGHHTFPFGGPSIICPDCRQEAGADLAGFI